MPGAVLRGTAPLAGDCHGPALSKGGALRTTDFLLFAAR